MQLLGLDEAETELELQHLDHLTPSHIEAVVGLHCMTYRFGINDRQPIFQYRLCDGLDGLSLLVKQLLTRLRQPTLLWNVPCLAH